MSAAPLVRLEEARRGRPGAAEAETALLGAAPFVPRDAGELARLHDALLFLRACPHSRRVLALAEAGLRRIDAQV